jgi:hypothetical protein
LETWGYEPLVIPGIEPAAIWVDTPEVRVTGLHPATARALARLLRLMEVQQRFFQVLGSMIDQVAAVPEVRGAGGDRLQRHYMEFYYSRGCAMGYMRRALAGDASAGVVRGIAKCTIAMRRFAREWEQALSAIRQAIRPEQVRPEVSAVLRTLLRLQPEAERLVQQAAATVRMALGTQIWRQAAAELGVTGEESI